MENKKSIISKGIEHLQSIGLPYKPGYIDNEGENFDVVKCDGSIAEHLKVHLPDLSLQQELGEPAYQIYFKGSFDLPPEYREEKSILSELAPPLNKWQARQIYSQPFELKFNDDLVELQDKIMNKIKVLFNNPWEEMTKALDNTGIQLTELYHIQNLQQMPVTKVPPAKNITAEAATAEILKTVRSYSDDVQNTIIDSVIKEIAIARTKAYLKANAANTEATINLTSLIKMNSRAEFHSCGYQSEQKKLKEAQSIVDNNAE